MHQLYQDAMSVGRVFGKPDIFTSNPNWPEMLSELKPFGHYRIDQIFFNARFKKNRY